MNTTEYTDAANNPNRQQEIQFLQILQNPLQLRTFLSLNQAEILKRLLASTDHNDSPAAILLATILLHKSDEKVIVNFKEEPLLSEEQKTICLEVLKKFYSLTDMEKLLIIEQQTQSTTISQLQQENESLLQCVAGLSAQVKSLSNVINSLERKVTANEKDNYHAINDIKKPAFFK